MTSSARRSSDRGIVRPRALAVLRLMTSSNFVGLFDWEVSGLGSLQDLVDEDRRAPPQLPLVRSVRHESTRLDERRAAVDRGQPIAGGEQDDGALVPQRERVLYDDQGGLVRPLGPLESLLQLIGLPDLERAELHRESLGGRLSRTAPGLAPFHKTAVRESPGISSFSSSIRLPLSSVVRLLVPVKFPPGRARLVTSPAPTRSAAAATTIGIVLVAA